MIKLQLHPDARMLRQFAWVSLGAFPGIAGLFRWRFDLPMPWVYALCALGVAVFGTELAGIPILARLVFRTLVLITFPIGLALFPLLVGVIYYGLFTPVGLLFRLVRRDSMQRRIDPAATSYWHARGKPREPASYFKLY